MLLDNALYAYRMLKWFKVVTSKLGFVPEGEFYPSLDQLLQDYPLPKWYDMIRNYLTRKPYSQAKLKLNFDCSTLLNGRDKNKETQNLSVILRRISPWRLLMMSGKRICAKWMSLNNRYSWRCTNRKTRYLSTSLRLSNSLRQ